MRTQSPKVPGRPPQLGSPLRFRTVAFVELPDSYTLMPIDQPAALARELRSFIAP
jgi:hypothetical protein